MELAVFLISLFVLIFTGLPIGIVLMACFMILMYFIDIPDIPYQLSFQVVGGIDSYVLITVPFFILAGEIMKEGQISKQLIDFSRLVVGRFKGGMGYVTVLACMLFAGLSGIAIADVSALGAMLVPMMVACGYDKGRATGLVCSASLTAPIIPPSLAFIVLGVAAELSIGRLFVMGIVPGILLGLSIMLAWFFIVRIDKYDDVYKVSFKNAIPVAVKAFPAVLLPVIIIVGIRMGYFTPTEGGAVACVYAFFVATVLNRALPFKKIPDIFFNTMKSTAVVMFIVGSACAIAWLISMADVPAELTEIMSGLTNHPVILLLCINLLLIGMGMVMDLVPIILIFSPVLFPLINAAGIDPYYFAIIMTLNLCIGLQTPPVGTVLFVGISISKLKMGQVVKGISPFFIAEVGFLILCLLVPQIITVPAQWFGYK
ncbi:MAG: TRAP transporter large permease [Succinatimonas hippei]|nr:TRAP transporter large permease [Succinatimonas hippei]